MVWLAMKQVVVIASRRSSSRIRAVATMPKSPRESMVGVVSSREMAPEVLSWSKVRQTRCLAMGASSGGGDMAEGETIGAEEMHRPGGGAGRQRRARLHGTVAGDAQGDIGAVRQMHIDIARLAQPLHHIDAARERDQTGGSRRHMLGPDADSHLLADGQ